MRRRRSHSNLESRRNRYSFRQSDVIATYASDPVTKNSHQNIYLNWTVKPQKKAVERLLLLTSSENFFEEPGTVKKDYK